MKKRILSIVLSIVMLVGLLPTTALAIHAHGHEGHYDCDGSCHVDGDPHRTVAASTWKAWTDDLAETQNGTGKTAADSLPTEPGNYYLTANVEIASTWKPADGTVLCLNGHTITKTGTGSVIQLSAGSTFTLTDCGSGKITGGSSGVNFMGNGNFYMYGGSITGVETTFGGGVNMIIGSFTMYGGSITGNTATQNGGGVYMTGGTFNMEGGSIAVNTANFGGGVCMTGGTFNMSGGSITGSTANESGGGVYINGGTFTMSGGSITGNTASQSNGYGGGGVYFNNGTFTMSSGSITDNTTTGTGGGGVFVSRTPINISGSPVITGNTKNGSANNVYGGSEFITVSGALTTDAQIGVTTSDAAGDTLTTGSAANLINISDKDIPSYFTSDIAGLEIVKNDSGELVLQEAPKYTVTFDANGHGTAPGVLSDVVSGSTINAPTAPEDPDWTFGGWYKEQTCENPWNFDTDTVKGDITLYARWFEKHDHKNCGVENCTAGHGCSNTSFLPWDGTGTPSGNVYLTQTVNPNGTYIIESGVVNLCLNGNNITQTQGQGTIFNVKSGATLNICDCQTTKGSISGRGDYCIYNNGGTVTVYDGTVSTSGNDGCGIYNHSNGGTVNIYDGNISGTHSGIYNYDGTITVSGGTVTGEYGIYCYYGTLNLSGAPTVTGTTADIYLFSNGTVITITGALTQPENPISVRMHVQGEFTSGWSSYMSSAAPGSYFTSAHNGYGVAKANNGELQLVPHVHDWTYSYDDTTKSITATCHGTGTCTNPTSTYELTIANDVKYSASYACPITAAGNWSGANAGTIVVTDNGLNNDLTNGLKGTATIKVNDTTVTTEATYTLQKADNAFTTAPAAIKGLTYTGEARALITGGTGAQGTVKYSLDNSNWSTEIPTAINRGDYTVYYKVEGGVYYEDIIAAEPIAVNIGKADPVVTAPTAKTGLIYNDNDQEVLDTAGSTTGGTIMYASSEENHAPVGDQYWSTNLPTAKNATTHYIWYKVVGDNNYYDVSPAYVEVTIAKADINPSVSITSWTYGESANAPSVTGNTGNGTVTYYYKAQDADDNTYTTVVPSEVGNYTVKATIAEASNYKGASITADFSITYASMTAQEAFGYTYDPNAWVNTDITFTAKNGYTVSDTAAGSGYDSTCTGTEEGHGVTKTVYVKDSEGKVSQVELKYNLDKTAPGISTVSGNPTEWTKDNAVISFTATDAPSGIVSVVVTCDDNQSVTYTNNSFTADRNGTYTITVTDKAGNEVSETVTVSKIDKAVPSLQIGVPTGTSGNDGWFTSAVTVPVTAGDGDGESGLDKWYYSLNGGTNWTEGSNGSFVISADGDYNQTVKIKAVDMAGNETVTTIAQVKVDTTAPGSVSVTAKVGESDYVSGEWTTGNVKVTLSATDTTSGIRKYQYSTDNGENWTDIVGDTYTHTASTGESGVTYIFRAMDNAGNTGEASNSITVKKRQPYTIVFNANGGEGHMNEQTMYRDTVAALTANTFTRTGYTFAGWATTADGNMVYENQQSVKDLAEMNQTVTLYAKWTPIPYDIAYTLNGGTATNPAGYTIESEAITLVNPTREGYTFKGWSSTGLEGDTNLNVTIATGSTGDRSYTANWTPITYDISYTLNGGEETNPATYTIESETITLTNPTRKGYTFKGWSGTGLEGDTNLNVTIAAGSVGDRTYTANWTANEYTITYEGMDGAAYGENNPVKHTYDTPTAVSNPTKTGYTFAGWKVNGGEAQTALTLAGDGYTADITLTATWTANSYKVVFNANGGEGEMADQSFTYDAAQALSDNAFTREGYKFVGWSLSSGGTAVNFVDEQNVQNLTAEPDGEVTLYAVWTRDIILSGTVVAPNVPNAEKLEVVLVGLDGTKYPASVTGNASLYHYTVTVPEGEYQLIVKDTRDGGVTVTAKEDLSEDKTKEKITMTMPTGNKNSIVDSTAAGDYAPIVGGIDTIAKNTEGSNVTVTLTVTHEESDDNDQEHSALMTEAGAQKSKLTFLEIGIVKKVDTNPEESITETSSTIEIVVPFDTTRKQNFKVYRFHDDNENDNVDEDEVDILTTTANADGEYIEVGTGSVTIHAKFFSLYAIGYTDVIPYYPVAHSCTSKCDVCGGCEDAACAESACKDKCRLLGMNFTDVAEGKWYTEAIEYVYHRKMMEGVGNNLFDINGTTTRAMIVTILWRLEGEPVVNYLMQFEDVPAETWYTEAVRWAASEGIVEGYSDTAFGSTDPITREQFATILWRYAKYKGYDVSVGEDTNILSYEDAFSISEYAIPAMQWACGAGLMQGDGVNLTPKADATRAQAAALFQRFCENVAEK